MKPEALDQAVYDATLEAEAGECMYASLVGPLLNVFYPLPFVTEMANRFALNSSSLARLWCSIYTPEMMEAYRDRNDITILPASMRKNLDHDSFKTWKGIREHLEESRDHD